MGITKEDNGKYFLKDGRYWRMDSWVDKPCAIMREVGTNRKTTVVFTAPIAKEWTLVDVDPKLIESILEQESEAK